MVQKAVFQTVISHAENTEREVADLCSGLIRCNSSHPVASAMNVDTTQLAGSVCLLLRDLILRTSSTVESRFSRIRSLLSSRIECLRHFLS